MLMNYHEMTMTEPRNSPSSRKQFLVICTIMAAAFLYSCLTSGLFLAVDPQEGVFPGGKYLYKSAQRDYAASQGLVHYMRKQDLKLRSEYDLDASAFHIYLDDPSIMGGRRQRWTTGLMEDLAEPEYIETLNKINAKIKKSLTVDQSFNIPASEVWPKLKYERAHLPKVKALILQFPYTNGFVSALITSYKIIPALRKLATEKGEKGNVPVVITNCSIKQSMCTHYVPLQKGKEFLLGKPDTIAHNAALGPEHFIDADGLKAGLKKVLPWIYDMFWDDDNMLPTKKPKADAAKSEL